MSTDENKALVQRTIDEVWNQGQLTTVEDLYTPDYVGNFAVLPAPLQGQEALKAFASHYLSAFPDIKFACDDVIAEGDRVMVRWTAKGTHNGPLMGIPASGKEVTVPGIWIHRIADGRIAEQWGINDTLGMMQQIGAIPAPAAAVH